MNAMLATEMFYSQDADRKLGKARSAREQAEKYHSEIQKKSISGTEEYCAHIRDQANTKLAKCVQHVRMLTRHGRRPWLSLRGQEMCASRPKRTRPRLRLTLTTSARRS